MAIVYKRRQQFSARHSEPWFFSHKEETTHLICKNTSIYNQLKFLFPFKLTSFNCQCTTVRYEQYHQTNNHLSALHFQWRNLPTNICCSLQTSQFTMGGWETDTNMEGEVNTIFHKIRWHSPPRNWSVCQHCVYWTVTYNQVINRIINIVWYTSSNRWHTDVHLQIWFTYSKR